LISKQLSHGDINQTYAYQADNIYITEPSSVEIICLNIVNTIVP